MAKRKKSTVKNTGTKTITTPESTSTDGTLDNKIATEVIDVTSVTEVDTTEADLAAELAGEKVVETEISTEGTKELSDPVEEPVAEKPMEIEEEEDSILPDVLGDWETDPELEKKIQAFTKYVYGREWKGNSKEMLIQEAKRQISGDVEVLIGKNEREVAFDYAGIRFPEEGYFMIRRGR